MEQFFKRKLSTDSSSLSNPGSSNARPIEVDEILANLQADPGLRTRMADYSPNIRDEIRRAYLQKGPCQPRSYKFPQTNQSGINRRFIAHWFDDHDWLEYSIAKDAAFCLHCYLFKSNFDQVGGDAFTGVGFNNWKKAKERFNLHIGPVGSVHNQAREVAYNLMHQTTHIETIGIKQTSQARTAYRTCLNASLKCTRYLLRQGLSFSGHDESAQSSNKGNYLELLQFLADHDEKVKAVVLENAPGNLKLIAPSIQKDLGNSCAKETIDLILSDVKDRYFSIMVDEARDVSIKEQMAMVLRYVNDKGQIIERFVGVQHVTDTTSSALKEAIDEFFSSANLSFSKLRGQGYDGASNMRALVAVAKKNIDVNSFFTTANSLVNVVGASCKRRDALRAQYQEELVRAFEDDCLITGRGLNQERTLIRAGDTRWNSHYGTLISIISMFPSVVNVLQMIVDDNPNDSSGEAYKLWREIQSFEFVFHLFVMKAILGITNTLSLALQKKDQDIVSAMNLVKTCKENLQLMRDNEFEELVEQASSFCYKHDIIVPTMDEEYVIPGRSRRNAPMKTNYHRYRVEIFIHVIDGQLAELNDRFNENFYTKPPWLQNPGSATDGNQLLIHPFDPDLTHATPGIDPVQAISNSYNIGSYDAHDSATIISRELSAPNSHLVQSHMPSSDATGPHLSAPPVPRHSLVTRSQDGSRHPSSKYSLDSFNPPYLILPHIFKHHHIQNGCVPCKKNMKHIYTIILGP
ncbi:hypothetical protein L3X38_010355 [Prunus dulcis]|uniref:TTF-type domain-containing protein n=1 Tax=Prunus dulcis TaxID=3755 RepID=A0AAD4WFE6_PRUDU|nr:hypothetical protein L3X38_010355 [Prunus dulcis]